jgi:chloramphenicol 3-O phosphotransferase
MVRVIFLNGPSSSGKSTLTAAIRAASPDPWLHLSIDHLRDSGAWNQSSYPDWTAARPAFFKGFHNAIAGFANAGNDLIVEHILDTDGWQDDLQSLLHAHQILFVRLNPPLDTLIHREANRKDRPLGSAQKDHALFKNAPRHDLTLTGTQAPQDAAETVLSALNTQTQRSAFFD